MNGPPSSRRRVGAVAALLLAAAAVAIVAHWTGGGSPPIDPNARRAPSSTQPGTDLSTVTGCATAPSRCGYPDGTNTGVPAGATLTAVPGELSEGPGWHWDSSRGSLVVDRDGAVLDHLDVSGSVSVKASDVTLQNLRITATGQTFGVALRRTDNVTIQDCEISSPDIGSNRLMVGVKDIHGDSEGTQILRNDIYHVQTGIALYGGLIADNYIHDLGYREGDHNNGTTSNGSQVPLTIRHNTILNQLTQTDAVFLKQDYGVEANRTVEDNLLAGGGYAIYGGAGKHGPSYNIKITNNRFSRIFHPKGGYYGHVAAFAAQDPGNEWTGNVWDDGGATFAP